MENITQVIGRIAKLLELAERGTEHEAARAAERAAELMAKYKLEKAEVEAAGEEVEVDPMAEEAMAEMGIRRVTWKLQIANAVARLNGCKIWTWSHYVENKRKVTLRGFGRKGDLQTTLYVTQYLWAEIDRLATAAAKKQMGISGSRHAKVWLNSFRLGCASNIYARVEAAASAREASLKTGVDAGSKALTIVSQHAQEVEDAYAKIAKERKLRNVSTSNRYISDAYKAGQSAGAGLSLGNGARGALGPAQTKITS